MSRDGFLFPGVVRRLDDDPLALPLWSSSSLVVLDVVGCLVGLVAEVDRFLNGPPFVGLAPRGLGMSEYSFDFSYST